MILSKFKKLSLLAGSALLFMGLSSLPSYADDSAALAQIAQILQSIDKTTQRIEADVIKIMGYVQGLPDFMNELTQMSQSVRATDGANQSGDPSKDDPLVNTFQQPFALAGVTYAADNKTQLATATGLDNSFFSGVKKTDMPQNPASLLYSSLMGNTTKFIQTNGDTSVHDQLLAAALNYVANASGYNITHKSPNGLNPSLPDAANRYGSYYNTVIPAQSFGANVLSQLYAEQVNGNATSKTQDNLIALATGQSWLATIASEDIGKVLRQILMFESQNYVVATQLLETQKKMLTAQVMTNAILIASSQWTEKTMYDDASKRGI